MTRQLRALLASLVVIAALAMCAPPRASDAAYALSADEAVSIICAHPWPCEQALAVAWRESNFQPDAYNPGCRCVGLFQIAGIHGYTADVLSDPIENTRIAYGLYQASGWAPWRTN